MFRIARGAIKAGALRFAALTFTTLNPASLILSLAILLNPVTAFAADTPKQIVIDWATYNPVSVVLKDKGFLEKEFEKDGIKIVWVQSAGSNKALEFLNAGSIDFGSTAGSAALVAKINGNPQTAQHRNISQTQCAKQRNILWPQTMACRENRSTGGDICASMADIRSLHR